MSTDSWGLPHFLVLVGSVWILLRLPGVLSPVLYRRVVNRLLDSPEFLLQALGLGLFVAGAFALSMVVASVRAVEVAGAVVAFLMMAGGCLWLFPNLVRDISKMLFFNRHPAWTRLVCLVAATIGGMLVWVGLKAIRS